ncbi:MAG: DUF952 domain-containing protein [Pseudomonadota bacterium]
MAGPDVVYKIVTRAQWEVAEKAGIFEGAPVDLADGYIHFSTAAQVAETAAKHFAGQNDLLLVAVDPTALGTDLLFEPSRGGQLFPHLYADLPLKAVRGVDPLPLGDDGRRQFPKGIVPTGRSGGPMTR